MVISKKGNFNQSTSSPKEKPQEGEWRSQEIWLCRFRQITLLCMPVPFSFYLTRLCPSTVSLSRQRHFSCPAFSSKKKLGEERSGNRGCKALYRATNRFTSPHLNIPSHQQIKPSGKRFLFFFPYFGPTEKDNLLFCEPKHSTLLREPRAQPCWCSAPVSTTPLLLSVCFDKIQETTQECNVNNKKQKTKPCQDGRAESC